jgi:NCAIR mutase (PurE)-related protein
LDKSEAPFVAVVTGGTSDMPVAEEAAITLELLGTRAVRVYDAGAAGLHRLLDQLELLWQAITVIAVAGMKGVLATVLGGLVSSPIVAVTTSVSYGASFEGLAALLAMLNSCAPGVAVVNIDNGFGAAVFAYTIAAKVS